ncbi:recombination protein NinB [Acidovorax sp.]|uniref:recombination protein NinB n=1 Tax=Acidovorax sp. TaxID=1872122 RepID=UPI0025BD3B43|nr:recombination protein NinB [Acidovorax sp.]MBL7090817.1 recombination protein NinB [Acidovorax sp.]
MDDTLTVELHNRAQAWAAIKGQVFPFLARVLQGGGRWVLSISRRKRTKAQNRRYWGNGVLKQIAEQATVNGRLYSAETWHEQFKRQFIGVVELPNGEVIGKSSTGLTTAEFCEFSDQVEAFAAANLGVTFYDLEAHG